MKYATSTSHRVSLVFSFKFWLVTVLLVLIYTSMLFAQYTNTIYLDPTNSGDPDQDGTIEHPFDHIADVTLSDNTDYLFNRGTQMDLTATINLQSSGIDAVRFRAYGSGDRPILYMSDQARDIFIIQGNKNIIIDSLHLLNYDTETGAVRGIEISPGYGSMPNTENVTISNCEIESGYVGINVQHGDGDYYTENLTISNCEIHHVGLDGIMIRDVTNGLIIGCNIHNVNQLWHTTTHTQAAGGDGIQIGHNCDSLKIYNNIVDRRTTGNKFALLLGNLTNVTEQCYTEIIGNTFYPPKDTIDDNGGVAVMFQDAGGAPNKVLFARNKIIGRKDSLGNSCQSAFRGDADTLYFYYNIIDSCNFNAGSQRITTDCDYTEIYNNVFMGGAISSTNVFGVDAITAIVKNNLSAGNTIGDPLRLAYVTNLEESNNLEIKSSNTSLYNSYLSITDWETSDFTRTSNLNDGAEVGLEYDLDSIPLGNPPEIGVCEFIEGGQTNTPPIINNQAFSIEENAINGTQVGMIIATDPDQGQTLTYSILSGNTDNAFQVNSTTGELTVNNSEALDYETNPEFNLTVQVQDNGTGSLTDQAIIIVNLININEIDQPATWLGNNSTDWNVATNWNTGLVPDENTIVHISGGLQYYPVIKSGEINIGSIGNGDYNCRMISINNGGKIELLRDNILNINSQGSITINNEGILFIGGNLNVNNSGRLYVLGGMINCSFDGKENGNISFYSGSGGCMNSGSITVFRSLQFFHGTNWAVNQGTIYCGGTSDEVLIIHRDEDLVLDDLIIIEGVSAQLVSDFYTYPLIINGDFKLGINSKFTNNTGKVISVGGKFLMESNESGTASFVNYGSVDISGQIEVQNYLEADRWHYISAPVSDDTAGVFMDMYLYSFDEATYNPYTNTPTGWTNIVDENIPLNVGEGYKVWSYSSMLGSENISFTGGMLNDGIINLPIYATDQDFNGNIGDGEGWNLVGNTYPSGVDWNHQSWVKQNIEGSVYVFDGVQYLVWPGSGNFGTLTNGIIPAMQAFFVKANDFDPSLIITNECRVHGVSSYKVSTINNLLVLSVDGNDYSDKTYINFNVNGNIGFDNMLDAYKLKGISEAPQLYTHANGKILSINVLPELVSDTIVSMGFEVGSNTEYVITASMLESFSSGVDIYLQDKLRDHFVNLRDQNMYRFTASPIDDSERFLIHFGVPHAVEGDESDLNDYLVIYSNENNIYIRNLLDNSINTELLLFNISGQEIMQDKIWIDDMKCISTSVKTGFYIVKLISEKDIFTEKIFLK